DRGVVGLAPRRVVQDRVGLLDALEAFRIGRDVVGLELALEALVGADDVVRFRIPRHAQCLVVRLDLVGHGVVECTKSRYSLATLFAEKPAMALLQLDETQIRTWTREQKDRWWLENVYRGDMPQLTARSAATGFLLGGIL